MSYRYLRTEREALDFMSAGDRLAVETATVMNPGYRFHGGEVDGKKLGWWHWHAQGAAMSITPHPITHEYVIHSMSFSSITMGPRLTPKRSKAFAELYKKEISQ